MIPTLNYKNVSLVFCNIWEEGKEFSLSFSNLLSNYFNSVDELKSKSIVVSEFTSELGIPLEKGMRTVINESMKLTNKPGKI
jgi:hypothetical protein